MPEGFDRERAAQPFADGRRASPVPSRTAAYRDRRRDDRDGRVVLGGRPDHRRPADVDLLDEIVEADARLVGRGGERIEVDDDEIERVDRGGGERLPMRRQPPIGEDAGVDARMERLDSAVEHFREAGHGGDVGHRQSGRAKRASRASGRNQLEARAGPGRRRTRRGRSCRTPTAALAAAPASSRPPATASMRTFRPSGAIESAPASARPDGLGQQPVLDRVNPLEERVFGVRRAEP